MKNKIKKWHITLMSFLTLFIAVFASLFSLRADTVDEETGEILTDNWELGVVFYDSTVDNGTTPLTEINWDASDGSYKKGTPRTITVQINYKNNSAVTTYQPGDLQIQIPNLIYIKKEYNNGTYIYKGSYEAQWSTSVKVGANDSSHTGYDWTFNDTKAPSEEQEYYCFTNTETIEEKANFEGSIQIQYTITPREEGTAINSYLPIERYLDECTHTYAKNIKATLIIAKEVQTITSPNWPNNYDNNLSIDTTYWEYTSQTLENLNIYFDKTSKTQSTYDKIYIYDKTGACLYTLSGTTMAGKTYRIAGNYIKIAMSSNSNTNYKGFSAKISEEKYIYSNEISLNYTRTYSHPWIKATYSVTKTASKISSYDGLSQNADSYIWVKYGFYISTSLSQEITAFNYPYIGCAKNIYLTDIIPENCIAYYVDGTPIDVEDNQIIIPYSEKMTKSSANGHIYGMLKIDIFLGYPKETYNEELGNLSITNTVNLYGTYGNETEETFLDDGSVSLNLANFIFNYSGELYGLSKIGYTKQNLSQYKSSSTDLMYQSIRDNDENNYIQWQINPSVYYTGTPLTVRIGDDLIFATNVNGEYEKLNDNDYYYTKIIIPQIKNRNNQVIPDNKYNCKLWIRYANTDDYILYEEFTNESKTWTFTPEQKIIAWYLQIDDMIEGISSFTIKAQMSFIKEDIPESGTLYNFAYLKVFSKDPSGNLTLLNTVDESSYANFITKELIASYDLLNHNGYIQRTAASKPWAYYKILDYKSEQSITKYNDGSITQDAENEQFTGAFRVAGTFSSTIFDNTPTLKVFFEQVTDEFYRTNMTLYDLLPKGMELISTEEEIIESLNSSGSSYTYNKNKQIAFANDIELKEFFKEHTNIIITKNWNNTGRTLLKIVVDFSDYPLLIRGKEQTNGASYGKNLNLQYKYNYLISYDSYLENGSTYINHLYLNSTDTNMNYSGSTSSSVIKDDGSKDLDAKDITEDGNTSNQLLYTKANITITSIVSTHQDVTTYVQTDQSNYSTGIVDTSCNSEYEYKLRVRTGSADVTNLVIYTSIEEAQPNRTRWYGEFLGIDTTYAENKGYTVKVWYSPNKTVGTLAEDNSWLEYTDSTNKNDVKSLAFQYLDSNGIAAKLPTNSLTYVLIKMKSPADENIKTLARMDCWTQWNALDDYDRPVDFITGINSNVVKVALPNSVDEDSNPSISLRFTKEIQGTDSEFKNMKLNIANQQTFMIRLTDLAANEDGSYNQVTALLKSNQELIISQIPVGTYLLEELGDNYFDFIDFTDNNDPEIVINGVTLERTNQGYVLTISEDLTENIEFNIKVTNEIEQFRPYEDKENKENLFLKNKIEGNE